jgi:hypothetical protein
MQFVESVAEKICNAFMFKIIVSIQKAIFSRSFAWIGGKMQVELYFTIVGGLYLYNKFESMDVSWSPWCLNC